MRYVGHGGHIVEQNEVGRFFFESMGFFDGVPVTGYGVLLLSASNTVSENRIGYMSSGILTLDGSVVSANKVHSSWVGICVTRNGTVRSNEVWWYRVYSYWWRQTGGLTPPEDPLFFELPLMCGIIVSDRCAVEANSVTALPSTTFSSTIPDPYLPSEELSVDLVAAMLASVGGGTSSDPLFPLVDEAKKNFDGNGTYPNNVSPGYEVLILLDEYSSVSGDGSSWEDFLRVQQVVQFLGGNAGILVTGVPLLILIAGFTAWNRRKQMVQEWVFTTPRFTQIAQVDTLLNIWPFFGWGGNTVVGNKVDVFLEKNPGRYVLPLQSGITTTHGFLAPPAQLTAMTDIPASGAAPNVLASNRLEKTVIGYGTCSPDRVESIAIGSCGLIGIAVAGPAGPKLEGCQVSDVYGPSLASYQWTTSLQAGDSVLIRPADLGVISAGDSSQLPSLVLNVHLASQTGDPVDMGGKNAVTSCVVGSHDAAATWWGGNYGSCVECYFYAMDPTASWDPTGNINQGRFAAIILRYLAGWETTGNLIDAAHMAHCLAEDSGSSICPIANYNDSSYFPPTYLTPANRWTNWVFKEGCYYLTKVPA